MKTKINTVLFGLFAAAFLTSCAETIYYQYKNGEPNFQAAKTQCWGYAQRTVVNRSSRVKTGEDCVVTDTYSGANIECQDIYETKHDWGYEARKLSAYQACLSEKGWAPCGQGGLHLPECQ